MHIDLAMTALLLSFASAAFLCGITWDRKEISPSTTRVIRFAMRVEFLSAAWMCYRPVFIQPWEAYLNLGLVGIAWAASAMLFDWLTRYHKIRTVAWALRVVLLMTVLGRHGYVGF